VAWEWFQCPAGAPFFAVITVNSGIEGVGRKVFTSRRPTRPLSCTLRLGRRVTRVLR
jgi:hypothetical protein